MPKGDEETHFTCRRWLRGHEAVVRILLEHNADPTCKWAAKHNATALHMAAANGHAGCARLLDIKGSRTTVEDEGGNLEWHTALVPAEVREALRLRRCDGCSREQLVGEKRFKKCEVCKQVWYCSRECQVGHWKAVHRAECERMREEMEEKERERESGSGGAGKRKKKKKNKERD